MFRFKTCYSYFFVSLYFFFKTVFPSGKNYHFVTSFLLQMWEQFSSYLSRPWIFYRLTEVHFFSDYHLNTDISLYLEVVSLPPSKPASLVLGSSSPPCSRGRWSCKLMSLPEIFLLKAECAILPLENHDLQNLLFATFTVLDHWLMK